jgi:hypothetical protein
MSTSKVQLSERDQLVFNKILEIIKIEPNSFAPCAFDSVLCKKYNIHISKYGNILSPYEIMTSPEDGAALVEFAKNIKEMDTERKAKEFVEGIEPQPYRSIILADILRWDFTDINHYPIVQYKEEDGGTCCRKADEGEKEHFYGLYTVSTDGTEEWLADVPTQEEAKELSKILLMICNRFKQTEPAQ